MSTREFYQRISIIVILVVAIVNNSFVIGQNLPTKMLRLYIDNDFLAYQKEDGAYTSGLRIDFVSERRKHPRAFVDKLYFHSGEESIVSMGWSLTQVMITSNDISKEEPIPGDYPYSGSLLITKSFNSMNPSKKVSIKTEYVAGIMGPYAFAGETQDSFHKFIGHNRPKGWDHQFPTTVFFNINVSTHRALVPLTKASELIVSGEISIGSLTNSLSIGSLLRVGRMLPYFDSHVQQFITPRSKRWQLYGFLKPQVSFVKNNVLLEGTLQMSEAVPPPHVLIKHMVFSADLGLVISYRVVAVSFTYKETTGLIMNQPSKALGNVSLYFGL